ncbi:MAG: ABC transporter permease [Planctomycetota bacterium]|jgi:ABC-type transport system involved in multi-copper enzyme maturation permease subunit
MTVDQAAYRRYEGTFQPGKGAIGAIAGTTIRRVFRRTWLRYLYFVVVLINTVAASFITFITHQRFIGNRSASEMVADGGGELDSLAVVLRGFLSQVGALAPIVAALTIAPLIAEDRRAKALPLYFSRPITHMHYVIGKLGAGTFFLAMLLLVPPIAMFAVDIANTPEDVVYAQRLGVLLRGMLPLAMLTVCLTSMSLGVSSLMERTNAASLVLFGLCIFATVAAHVLAREIFEDPAYFAIDPFLCAQAIGNDLLPAMPSMINLSEVSTESQELAPTTAWWGLSVWAATGLFVLWLRVRKVEVVE